MTDKISAIVPVILIAALEIEKRLKEVWWQCKECKEEFSAGRTFCPGCGSLDHKKILKSFTGKIGIGRFVDD